MTVQTAVNPSKLDFNGDNGCNGPFLTSIQARLSSHHHHHYPILRRTSPSRHLRHLNNGLIAAGLHAALAIAGRSPPSSFRSCLHHPHRHKKRFHTFAPPILRDFRNMTTLIPPVFVQGHQPMCTMLASLHQARYKSARPFR